MPIAACAGAGCALAYGIALKLPETYKSSAVMRITPSFDPKQITGETPAADVPAWIARVARIATHGRAGWTELDQLASQRSAAIALKCALPQGSIVRGRRRGPVVGSDRRRSVHASGNLRNRSPFGYPGA